MSLYGLFGFLGFLYFSLRDPVVLVFFLFFGFFSFYWDGKLEKERKDERLMMCRLKAITIAFRVLFVITLFSLVFIGSWVGKSDPAKAYAFLTATISLGIVLSANLASFLAYKFFKHIE